MLKKRTEGDVLRMGAAGEGEGAAAWIGGGDADKRGRLFPLRDVDPRRGSPGGSREGGRDRGDRATRGGKEEGPGGSGSAVVAGTLSADELLKRYATLVFAQTGNARR